MSDALHLKASKGFHSNVLVFMLPFNSLECNFVALEQVAVVLALDGITDLLAQFSPLVFSIRV